MKQFLPAVTYFTLAIEVLAQFSLMLQPLPLYRRPDQLRTGASGGGFEIFLGHDIRPLRTTSHTVGPPNRTVRVPSLKAGQSSCPIGGVNWAVVET